MSFDHPHAHTICREVMTYASRARYRTDIVQDIAKIVLSKSKTADTEIWIVLLIGRSKVSTDLGFNQIWVVTRFCTRFSDVNSQEN